jgi:A/G-specific adenine glycosylase
LELNRDLTQILLDWYEINARDLPWRRDTDPYRVLVSEIMLQQTRAEVVKGYFERFLSAFPTLSALADADEEKVNKLWEGLGYYSRARNLQKAARVVVREMGGAFPDTCDELHKLPGVGPYTAGAVASICFHRPTPAVDGNVLRIAARIAEIKEAVDLPETKKSVTAALAALYPAEATGAFTQALMELGATVCLPNGAPRCGICPVAALCRARNAGTVARYPVRLEKRPRREQKVTVFMLTRGDTAAIRQRPKRGLLAGLWELPNMPEALNEQQALDRASEWGARPARLLKSVARTHVFTHIVWDMTCYYIECAAQPEAFVWADRITIAEVYAVPSAFRMFFEETALGN